MDRIAEIQARLADIDKELDTVTGEAYTKLENEARTLMEELKGLKDEATRKKEMRASIAAGLTAGNTIEKREEETPMEKRTFTLESEEYRSAFLKNLRGEDLTEVEQRAFTFLTTTTTAPLPTVMQNRIIDLIGEEHPIVADVDTLHSGTSITIPVGKAIAADAGKSEEGADANEL